MKTNQQCDHRDGDRRCHDSAGYRVRKTLPYNSGKFLPGRFCLRHAGSVRDRVPLERLPPEDR